MNIDSQNTFKNFAAEEIPLNFVNNVENIKMRLGGGGVRIRFILQKKIRVLRYSFVIN